MVFFTELEQKNLQSVLVPLHRVGHDWSDLAAAAVPVEQYMGNNSWLIYLQFSWPKISQKVVTVWDFGETCQ